MKTVQYHQAQSAYNLRCRPIYQHSARLTCWNTVRGATIYNILYFTGCKITSYWIALPCIAMIANRTFSIGHESCSVCVFSNINLKCNVLVPPKMQTHTHPILTLLYVNLMEMWVTRSKTAVTHFGYSFYTNVFYAEPTLAFSLRHCCTIENSVKH